MSERDFVAMCDARDATLVAPSFFMRRERRDAAAMVQVGLGEASPCPIDPKMLDRLLSASGEATSRDGPVFVRAGRAR